MHRRVAYYEDGEREWLVLDASGASIGRFRLPTRWRIDYANQHEAWVVERDALDIPYVVRYEIVHWAGRVGAVWMKRFAFPFV